MLKTLHVTAFYEEDHEGFIGLFVYICNYIYIPLSSLDYVFTVAHLLLLFIEIEKQTYKSIFVLKSIINIIDLDLF